MIKKISILFLFSAAMVLVSCDTTGPKLNSESAPSEPKTCKGRDIIKDGGPVLGSLIEGIVQQELDQNDERMARQTALRALDKSPDGLTQAWRNPNTDKYGQSTAIQTMTGKGTCRILSSVVYDPFGFKLGDEKVRYCRQADGSWLSAS